MKLPKARKRGDAYRIELMFNGKRYSATRDTPKECEQWAALKILGLKANAGESVSEETKPIFTFKQLFNEYFEKVGRHSKSKDWILVQYKTFETKFGDLAHKNIHDITPQDLTAWRNGRSTQVKENTVLKEISLFSAMFTYAQKEMFLLDVNAWMQISKPVKPESRYRRISQAEIDALLNGDSEVKDEPTASVSGESDIRPYDPNTQRRVVRERLQALEIINERFARHFRMGLFNLLRRSPDITVGAIRIQPYHEFARNLPVPTNLNLIHLKPLRGTGLVVFSPSLVFIAVDNLFGGDGRFPTKVEGREFTHTEQRVINRMLKLALEGYSDAWKAINPLEVEYVRSEMQVKFTNITTSPNDIVVNTPFHVEIGNLTGEFNICLPFSMIEPLRELLVNPPLENSRNEDQNWRDNLVRQVQHSQLELVANFADISLRLSQILKLKPGDVLPIEKPDRIIAHVDGVPVLTSQYGTLNGQYALRIEHLINPILNSLNEEQPK